MSQSMRIATDNTAPTLRAHLFAEHSSALASSATPRMPCEKEFAEWIHCLRDARPEGCQKAYRSFLGCVYAREWSGAK